MTSRDKAQAVEEALSVRHAGSAVAPYTWCGAPADERYMTSNWHDTTCPSCLAEGRARQHPWFYL